MAVQKDLEPPKTRQDILNQFEYLFRETGDAYFALETFILTSEYGLELPNWTINWITSAFKKFYASDGKASLNDLLGLKGRPGKFTPIQKTHNRAKTTFLVEEVLGLIAIGVPWESALVAVYQWSSKRDGMKVAKSTLRKEYFKAKKDHPHYLSMTKRHVGKWTKARRESFLKKYSEELGGLISP